MRLFLTALLLLSGVISHAQNTIVFNYTGAVDQYIVPPCVSQLEVTLQGAEGGGVNGGNGSTVSGLLDVVEGQILEIRVGGSGSCPNGGYNGGGEGGVANTTSNYGCGGGGASDIRIAPYSLNDRLVIASGGGGMGGGDTDAVGGNGGCDNGVTGDSPFGVGGFGGSQASGGNGGPPWITQGNTGGNGSLGIGGFGATDPCYNLGPGGGGGGGYYGGGGGGSDCYNNSPLGGGGGGSGSSLVPAGFICTGGNVNSSGSITITPIDGLTLEVFPTTPNYCEGDSIMMTITGADNYQWSPNENIDDIAGSEVWISADTTTVYTIIGSNEDCADTIDVQVNVGASYFIQNTINLCDGESYILPDGTEVNSAGSYPISFQTVNNLCDSIITTEINVYEPITVSLTQTICEGDAVVLEDGTIVNQDGIYPIVLTSLINGCDSTIITEVIVMPIYDLVEDVNACDDGNYVLPDGTTPAASGTFNFNFQTDLGCDSNVTIDLQLFPEYNFTYYEEICDGESYTLPDGSSVENQGDYTTILQTVNGCDSTISVSLVVNELPELNIGLASSYCPYEGDITLSPAPSGGNLTGDLLNGFILEHEGASAGVYNVSYSYTDNNGCANIEDLNYVLSETLYPTYDFEISCNDLHLISLVDDPDFDYSYDWYLNDEFVAFGPDFTVNFYENGEYNLALDVTDTYGCTYSFDGPVYLEHVLDIDGFFIPNVFTPNDDGKNEEFRIPSPYHLCIDYTVNIFNKWGDLIYTMTNETPNFTGLWQNGSQVVSEGVYYYTLEVKDYPCSETPELRDWCSGSFSLFRD